MHHLVTRIDSNLGRVTFILLVLLHSACASKDITLVESEKTVVEIPPPLLTEAQRAEYALALKELKEGKLALAKKGFESLINQVSTLSDAYINLGLIELKAGQPDKAIAQILQGLKYSPNNAQGYVMLGQAYFSKGDINAAEESYVNAIKFDDGSLYAHYGLGVIYDLYLGEYDKAAAHYQSFVDMADGVETAANIKRVKTWIRLLDRKKS